MSKIIITGDIKQWASKADRESKAAMAEMATDLMRLAQMNAPKASGALVRSGRVNPTGDGSYKVQFGDSAVRYAYRRHYENKKNPGTLKYLERAAETVRKGNVKKYFR